MLLRRCLTWEDCDVIAQNYPKLMIVGNHDSVNIDIENEVELGQGNGPNKEPTENHNMR
jgi:hypothetical protein